MSTWGGRRVAALRGLVLAEYGRLCWLCHQPIDLRLSPRAPGGFSIDHVLPRSRGGTDDLDNLRPAHRRCNLSRGNRPAGRFRPARPTETGAGFFDRATLA